MTEDRWDFPESRKIHSGDIKEVHMIECKSIPTLMMMNLKKINDDDSNEIVPQLIGSLMYLVNTRLDLCYAMNVLSHSMSQSRQTHWTATKHVLRYLWGTVGYGLRYSSSVDLSLQGYVDADWVGSAMDQKSTSNFCFTLGSSMVSWCSRKHSSVALSTAKAE